MAAGGGLRNITVLTGLFLLLQVCLFYAVDYTEKRVKRSAGNFN